MVDNVVITVKAGKGGERKKEKTNLLVHCMDRTSEDLLADYAVVRKEFKKYSKDLLKKPEIVLLTKADLVDTGMLKQKIKLLTVNILDIPFFIVTFCSESEFDS